MLPRLIGSTPADGRSFAFLDQVPGSMVLDLLLGRPCDPSTAPQDLSLALALLQICDEAVRSGSQMILFFVLLAALANPDMSSPSDTASALLLWSSAQQMLSATPRSMLAVLSGAEARDLALRLPIGAVAPDEVLHHVYERQAGEWRLVVVDLRDLSFPGLPVCLRLPDWENFEEFAESLPREPSIHLCLLADDPLEALKLCLYLSGPNGACRPHVSVADGGWQAVRDLAQALDLELLPETDACPGQDTMEPWDSTGSLAGTVVEVAEHVASITSVAASVALKGASWATGARATNHGREARASELLEV